jgi:uncharacterized membrane protein YdbT with pleckstrin-like domain
MFCIKCGARNSDEAVYCRKCGILLEAEEETRVVQKKIVIREDDGDEELKIFSIRPTLLFVKIGYALAVLGAFLLAAIFAAVSSLLANPIYAGLVILFGLSLLLIPAFYHLKNKTVKYTLTDSKIEISKGLISHTTRNLPLRSIQDVVIKATVPQRLLGFGDIIIENATEEDEQIILKNINSPGKYADILLKQMRRLNK